ncbi:hypothetical protein [Methanocaldococcus infernus]|uniref:hypothetical protein n=1 Tax=Methanocaldococcus infernus TaxID=67760 RepID=UPI0001A815C5|nr:hypothetical protein [Methanocaldococcus infernus]
MMKRILNIFKNSSSHRLLTSYLKALDDILNLDGELEVIVNYLSNLRELRNIADYETSERVRAC